LKTGLPNPTAGRNARDWSSMDFFTKLNKRIDKTNSLLCVGLDSDTENLPAKFKNLDFPQLEFNKFIISETNPYVCAYKPNTAFYESRGEQGVHELKSTCDFLSQNFPDIPIILDAKRGDIGNTNKAYAKYIFEYLKVDAVTLHPYLGKESLENFLAYKDKGLIILCKTSNPGAGEFQDLVCNGKPLWQIVAQKVSQEWNTSKNCGLVVGATYPEELKAVRKLVEDMTILVPGIGSQGGDLEAVLRVGLNSQKRGALINASRSIIFAPSPATEAKVLRNIISNFIGS
jgi:orotidine-5'-phosphate decarboxylase